ncbi:MAG: MlaD family protein [Propionibacteriales bacterium]|nr:MlaD family protein [Propionibacteriales bacterium]
MKRITKVQLATFAVITVLTVVYGAVRFLDLGSLVNPPYEVSVDLAEGSGIYPRAEVELLGTRVGSVRDVRVGEDGGTLVVLALDRDIDVPVDVQARVSNKSAIGEQYVALIPMSAGGPYLADGATIPRERTATPVPVEQLLGNVRALVDSVPTDDLTTALDELATASDDLGAPLGRLLDSTDTITSSTLASAESLTSLIRDARTVLRTQRDLLPTSRAALGDLAPVLEELQARGADIRTLLESGARAGDQVVNLLDANQEALPVLLNDLQALADVVDDNLPEVRKSLAVLPWALEMVGTTIRYCDDHDARTGLPVESTCSYDVNGDPIYSLWLGVALDQAVQPCTNGYEGTERWRPDGRPIDRVGPRQGPDTEPNLSARCTSSPYDPYQPNVRGPQNIPDFPSTRRPAKNPAEAVADDYSGSGRARPEPGTKGVGYAMYDVNTGLLLSPEGDYRLLGISGEVPPGADGLGWLLGHTLRASR